ncbi:hypothetical protein CDAR_442041 [Caerostris darwini]|uniref:Uncharacterized protein n=1 Tax=Caerostris darwini TaxID=1538125 RepID=A0AAV4V1T8_9ARAC|nr:hypothetical protein CDAR_442041 [Caerostris darwini]
MHLPISARAVGQQLRRQKRRIMGLALCFLGPGIQTKNRRVLSARKSPRSWRSNGPRTTRDFKGNEMGHHVCSSEIGFIIRHYRIIPTGNPSNNDFVPDGSYDEGLNVGPASWHEMVQYTTYGMISGQYIPFRTR